LCGEPNWLIQPGNFLFLNPFLNNILILIKKVFANLTFLVAPERLARQHHFITPHALAR
jgi:hypothetical protein